MISPGSDTAILPTIFPDEFPGMSSRVPDLRSRTTGVYRRVLKASLTAFVVVMLASGGKAEDFGPAVLEFFEKSIRPLLINKFQSCHGAEKAEGELRLDSRAGVLEGGSRSAAAIAEHPEMSLIIKAVDYSLEDLRMPPDSKLSDEERSLLSEWIQCGLPWPPGEEVQNATSHGWTDERIAEMRNEHWSFRPVISPAVPLPQNSDWPDNDADRFLLATVEKQDLKPETEADRRTLLRRVTYDLTGLPPRPEDVDAFLRSHRRTCQAAGCFIRQLLTALHRRAHV